MQKMHLAKSALVYDKNNRETKNEREILQHGKP